MGLYHIAECIITGLPADVKWDHKNAIEYWVQVNGKRHFISLSVFAANWKDNEPIFKENKALLEGLLYNDNWIEDESTKLTLDKLQELVSKAPIPATPQQKLDNLLLHLYDLQEENGVYLELDQDYLQSVLWKVLYFKSYKELEFYMKCLDQIGLLNIEIREQGMGFLPIIHGYQITLAGLNQAIQLREEGGRSN